MARKTKAAKGGQAPALAADKQSRVVHVRQVGTAGTMTSAGFIKEEYRPELATVWQRMQAYERMRKGDSTIDAMLTTQELPIMRGTWDVEPAGRDPEHLEHAAFVRFNLFDAMDVSWADLLWQILGFKQFGFSYFEKVYRVGDWTYEIETPGDETPNEEYLRPNMVMWKRLAYLGQKAVFRWYFDDEGNPSGVEQRGWWVNGYDAVYKSATIEGEDMILFVNRRRGNNPEGESALRPAYKHWEAIDRLYIIEQIGLERMATGLPYFELPEQGISVEDSNELKAIIKSLSSHEESGMVLPAGVKFDIKLGGLQSRAIQDAITHHRGQMLLVVLAQFLAMGMDKTSGNRALGQTHRDFLVMTLWSIAEQIADTFNRGPIKELVDKNYPGVTKYPKLRMTQLAGDDLKSFIDILVALTQGGLLTAYPALEEHLIRMLKLPPKPDEQPTVDAEGNPVDDTSADPSQQGTDAIPDPGESTSSSKLSTRGSQMVRLSSRYLKQPDRKRGTSFAAIGKSLDHAEASFQREATGILDRQRDLVAQELQGAIDGGSLERILDLPIPLMHDYRGLLEHHLVEMADLGQRHVAEELGKPPVDVGVLKNWAHIKSGLLADKHVADLRFQVLGGALDAMAEKRMQPDTVTKLADTFVASSRSADFARLVDMVGDVLG